MVSYKKCSVIQISMLNGSDIFRKHDHIEIDYEDVVYDTKARTKDSARDEKEVQVEGDETLKKARQDSWKHEA